MVSGIITAVLIVLFVYGWIWAWSSKRKPAFDAAARLALDADDGPEGGTPPSRRTQDDNGEVHS